MAVKEIITSAKVSEIRNKAVNGNAYKMYFSGHAVIRIILAVLGVVFGFAAVISTQISTDNIAVITIDEEIMSINMNIVMLLAMTVMMFLLSMMMPSRPSEIIYVSKEDVTEQPQSELM